MSTKRRPASRPDFSSRLAALPTQPGVYIMKNAADEVLYVGKAQSLRNRVRSYSQSQIRHDPKTRELVSQMIDLEVIRTDPPTGALIVENGVVKRHWPRFNIRLKDNATYPYLKI